MAQEPLQALLADLISTWESEVVEFKNVGDSYSTSDIGKYFSALANEANLRNLEKAWLVFGVDNHSRNVVGSNYRRDRKRLHALKHQVSQDTEPGITFRDIHELETEQGRVLLFEIPAAPMGIPIAWKGHYYARAGESLTHLGLDKQDEIRAQTSASDWTAQVVERATAQDLDAGALTISREAFARKYANRFEPEEVMSWSDTSFLDRAKVTTGGQISKAALLLLGRAESAHLLSPHPGE